MTNDINCVYCVEAEYDVIDSLDRCMINFAITIVRKRGKRCRIVLYLVNTPPY